VIKFAGAIVVVRKCSIATVGEVIATDPIIRAVHGREGASALLQDRDRARSGAIQHEVIELAARVIIKRKAELWVSRGIVPTNVIQKYHSILLCLRGLALLPTTHDAGKGNLSMSRRRVTRAVEMSW